MLSYWIPNLLFFNKLKFGQHVNKKLMMIENNGSAQQSPSNVRTI